MDGRSILGEDVHRAQCEELMILGLLKERPQ